jgi:hypothetical protein
MRREIILLLLLALFSFLWAADIGVTRLFYHLPLFNKLRYPFKLAFFTSFFLIMAASIGFDRFIATTGATEQRRLQLAAVLLALHLANFAVLYGLFPQRLFSAPADRVPFDEPLKAALSQGRIVTGWLDPVFSGTKSLPGLTVPTLGYNYATLWGLHFFGGYDPLMPERNFNATMGRINRGDFNVEKGKSLDIVTDVPLEIFRRWGVKWYVFEKSIPLVNTGGLVNTSFGDETRNVLNDPAALPLVYWSADPKKAGITYRFSANSVGIEADSNHGGELIVNLLYHPFFRAFTSSSNLVVGETAQGQIVLTVPPGHQVITLRYVDRDFVTFGPVSLVVAVCLVAWWPGAQYVARRRREGRADA